METQDFEHILIREFSILIRIPCSDAGHGLAEAEIFDVRTGVRLPAIHPELRASELDRGYRISQEAASVILEVGQTVLSLPTLEISKVVSIMDIKQRKLDSVVADSILDQVRKIADILQTFLQVAAGARKEERLWLSQQALTLVRKFSGRELAELENVVEWFGTRSPRE